MEVAMTMPRRFTTQILPSNDFILPLIATIARSKSRISITGRFTGHGAKYLVDLVQLTSWHMFAVTVMTMIIGKNWETKAGAIPMSCLISRRLRIGNLVLQTIVE